jgi:hypothetical protein
MRMLDFLQRHARSNGALARISHAILVLLRHKFLRRYVAALAPQQGQRGISFASVLAMRARIVAIEFGT